jgi:hypothetical protein
MLSTTFGWLMVIQLSQHEGSENDENWWKNKKSQE